MTTKIARLKDGSDVICEVEFLVGMVELIYPMMFSVVNQSLVLQHWLPLAVMEGNSVTIPLDEVVCFMEPNLKFKEYYEETVSKLTSVIESSEEEADQIMEALEELESSKGVPIH